MLKINKLILIDILSNNPKLEKLEDTDNIESITVVPAGLQITGSSYDKRGKEEKIHLVITENECTRYGATVIKKGLKTRVE